MRIIGGRLKRHGIKVPRGDSVRPTTDRTREAIFNLVEARLDLDETDVLDLFAGSGALGLESLSRGARSATFIERERKALQMLRLNVSALGLDEESVVLQVEAFGWLRRYRGEPFDLILADPPYDFAGLADLPRLVLAHVRPGGLFVLEHDRRFKPETEPGPVLSRQYGRTVVSIYSPDEQAETASPATHGDHDE